MPVKYGVGFPFDTNSPECRNIRSMSLHGFSSPRPYPPSATSASGTWESRTGRLLCRRFQQVTQQHVEDRRLSPADFPSPGPGPVQHFQPVPFPFEEAFVPRQFLGRWPAWRQRQTLAASASIFSTRVGTPHDRSSFQGKASASRWSAAPPRSRLRGIASRAQSGRLGPMTQTGPVQLKRDCEATQIPAGTAVVLPAGTPVAIIQTLGGAYTVEANGGLFRLAASDADCLGLAPAEPAPSADPEAGPFSRRMNRASGTLCAPATDPEIPVNIVDLGLVYDLHVETLPSGSATGGCPDDAYRARLRNGSRHRCRCSTEALDSARGGRSFRANCSGIRLGRHLESRPPDVPNSGLTEGCHTTRANSGVPRGSGHCSRRFNDRRH